MAAAYHDAAARGFALALVATMALAWQCEAQQAPSSGPGCMPELVSLNPCMDYMSGGARRAVLLGRVGHAALQPGCLCMVVGGTAATLGVAVDGDRALRLPAACKVQAPSASQCNRKRS